MIDDDDDVTDDVIEKVVDDWLNKRWCMVKIRLEPDGSAISDLLPEGRWKPKEIRWSRSTGFMLYLEADSTEREVHGVSFSKEDVAVWLRYDTSEPWIVDIEEST
jgi:hypothetical protein